MQTMVGSLIPLKVLNAATVMGAHEECIELDWEGSCENCRKVVQDAFDFYYGDAVSSDEAFMMIINDILEDRNSD